MGQVRKQFERVKCLVLDEADRILDEVSTKEDVNYILDCCKNRKIQFFISATENEFLGKLREKSHQFNATLGNEKDLKLAFSLPETLQMQYILCPDELKDQYMQKLIDMNTSTKIVQSIVFSNSVKNAEILHRT